MEDFLSKVLCDKDDMVYVLNWMEKAIDRVPEHIIVLTSDEPHIEGGFADRNIDIFLDLLKRGFGERYGEIEHKDFISIQLEKKLSVNHEAMDRSVIHMDLRGNENRFPLYMLKELLYREMVTIKRKVKGRVRFDLETRDPTSPVVRMVNYSDILEKWCNNFCMRRHIKIIKFKS